MRSKIPDHVSDIRHAYGWYSREEYPDRKPVRWMKGVKSILVLDPSSGRRTITFEYIRPNKDCLTINAHRVRAEVRHEKLIDGWTKASIHFNDDEDRTAFVTLEAQKLFEAPPDPRKFGCQVSDIEVR